MQELQIQKFQNKEATVMFKLLKNKKGQGMVEYILIIVLVVIVVIAGLKLFGGNIKKMFDTSNQQIQSEAMSR